MILKKIGEDYYKGNCRNVYLVCGVATRDAEDKGGGVPHVSCGLSLGKDANGTKQYINLDAWRERARDLKGVCKGDSVLALGTASTHEYNGKTYTDFSAVFIAVSGGSVEQWPSPMPVSAGEGVPVFVEDDDDDDGELPF